MHKVFVYGTLKNGEPNHYWFQKEENGVCKFISSAKTNEKFPLIVATNYNIPFLLYKPGVGHNVHGEIYEVDDIVLKNLDILEEHPTFYQREQHNVISDSSEVMNVWIYFIKNFGTHLLDNKFYENYKNGMDGQKYVERYLRDPSNNARSEIVN